MKKKSNKAKKKEEKKSEKTEEKKEKKEKKHEDVSELEEEVESSKPVNLNLGNFNFDQFINLGNTVPILEGIAWGEAGPRFVPLGRRQTTDAATLGANGNGDDTTYLSSRDANEPKYTGSGEHIYKAPERIEVEQAGRGRINELNVPRQEEFFQSALSNNFESRRVERISARPERVDAQNIGRQNPVEVEKEKYQKYDFEKKSSY